MIKKLKNILKISQVQRGIYGFGFGLWTFLMWKTSSAHPFAESSAGLPYFVLYSIPAAILGLQVIINNKILWSIIFGLFSLFVAIVVFMATHEAIVRSGNHVKAIRWDFEEIALLLLVFGTLGAINWVIYQIKPN